jgi:hypothetical protein
MNWRHVPVTLPRARFDIDAGGHLTVTVDGEPWQPSLQSEGTMAAGPGMSLGRSDVPWVQQQIANGLGTPVLVEVADHGHLFSDVVDPDGYQLAEPGRPEAPAEAAVGRFVPGEPVVISVVVDRTHADEYGHVRYRLPAAVGDRAVLVHGETSGIALPLELSPLPKRPTNAVETPSPRSIGRNVDTRRRQSGSGHAPQPAQPAQARRDTPDAGVGAL